jgi:hypothetical protein
VKSKKDPAELEQLLDFVVQSAPRLEAGPFFASRVAHLAETDIYSFAGSLQAFARRLVPVFTTLTITICLALHHWQPVASTSELTFFDEEAYQLENITLENVADSLDLLPGEENEDYE